MKTILLLFTFFGLGLFAAVAGQNPAPQNTPNQAEINRQANEQRIRTAQEFNRLRNMGSQAAASRFPNSPAAYQNIQALYRKPTDKELKLVASDKQDLKKYADFLRQPNTGLTKLVEDRGCAENPNVVVANPDCLAYTMPGAGSSFSFRVKDYRLSRLADITFTKNSFLASGIRLQGFFTELGDIPLEQINLKSDGLEFAINFKAAPDFPNALEDNLKFIKGVTEKGFLYRRAIAAKNDMTYVLRSVAYRGKYLRAVQKVVYDELEFDKRNDVIIAFRVVRRDGDGAVTILWKQMAKQESPRLKFDKDGRGGENRKSKLVAGNK